MECPFVLQYSAKTWQEVDLNILTDKQAVDKQNQKVVHELKDRILRAEDIGRGVR